MNNVMDLKQLKWKGKLTSLKMMGERLNIYIHNPESTLSPNVQTIKSQKEAENYVLNQNQMKKCHTETQRQFCKNDKSVKTVQKKKKPRSYDQDLKNCKFTKQQQNILKLDPSLILFKQKHNIGQYKPQIKYLRTIQKTKLIANKTKSQIKFSRNGADISLKKIRLTLQSQIQDRQVTANLKKKIHSTQQSYNLLNHQTTKTEDTAQKQKSILKKQTYKHYPLKRLKAYINCLSNQKIMMPQHLHQEHAYLYSQPIKRKEDSCQEDEEEQILNAIIEPEQPIRTSVNGLTKSNLGFKSSPSPSNKSRINTLYTFKTASKKSLSKDALPIDFDYYEESISEFQVIVNFFQKIHNEIIKYSPMNHLSSKINQVLSKIQNQQTIRNIFIKCQHQIKYFSKSRIYLTLSQYDGILSNMNYLANTIKIAISTERRRRFREMESRLNSYTATCKNSTSKVIQKFKSLEDNDSLKSSLSASVKQVDIKCLGMKEKYLEYLQHAQNLQFSEKSIDAVRNTNLQCEILRYEALIK